MGKNKKDIDTKTQNKTKSKARKYRVKRNMGKERSKELHTDGENKRDMEMSSRLQNWVWNINVVLESD